MERPKTDRKIIIHIDASITETEALAKVSEVVSKGRVSTENGRETFCFATVYERGTVVTCRPASDTTDTFHVWKREVKNDIQVQATDV